MHVEKIKKIQGEFKCAQKGIENLPRRYRMPTKEKPKTHTRNQKHINGTQICMKRN